MKLLPYQRFCLETTASADDIVNGIEPFVTREGPAIPGALPSEVFSGRISPEGFKLIPVLRGGRNSFLPIIVGRFESTQRGTAVRVSMRLHVLVAVFLAFWITFVLSFGLVGIRGGPLGFVPVAAVMATFAWLMTVICFWRQVGPAKERLTEFVANASSATTGTGEPPLRPDPPMDGPLRRTRRVAGILIVLGVANFVAAGCVSEIIGGDAINGKVDRGHYFLGNKGEYTEVSPAVYYCSLVHMTSMFLSVFVVAGGGIAYSLSYKHEMILRRTNVGRGPPGLLPKS